MLHRVPQRSGHTLSASHIEAPTRAFFVRYWASAFINVFSYEAGRRWVRVLAETPAGALRIARYHHSTGRDFRLIEPPTRGAPAARPQDGPAAPPVAGGLRVSRGGACSAPGLLTLGPPA